MPEADYVTRAEILWTVHTVMTHMSINAAAESVKLFSTMFEDSKTACEMSLQKTKISYFITHGLGPFFQNKLTETIKKCDFFVVGFDESLNKYAQKGQMDLFVRFWLSSKEDSNVVTQYYNSAFLNHATAEILLDSFISSLKNLNLRKLLQVSMDGPNVNLKFLKLLKKYLADEFDSCTQLLEIGSCGLQIVHNAFKTSFQAPNWNVKKFLIAIFFLFENSPARKGDYNETNKKVKDVAFPKRFCSTRWVENADVASHSLQILPQIRNYVKFVQEKK